MTDNEIIKALEWHSNDETHCSACPYEEHSVTHYCVDMVIKDALDLINRQKAEIENLKDVLYDADGINLVNYWHQQCKIAENGCKNFIEENESQKAEIERLNKALADSNKHLEEGIALAKQTPDMVISAVTEVIKGLLDKIEKQAIPNEVDVYWVEHDDIYNLVKEMVGEG